jgi:hypothetical protein
MRWVKLAVGSALVVAAAVFTAVQFGSFELRQARREVQRLEQERARLVDYVRRLGASRRVAQVEVLRQRQSAEGQTVSTLLWQEIGPDGTLGLPVAVEVVGTLVYFEAAVIKFDQQFVQEGDPERGVSLAMFRRIFGDQQAPESVPDLDRQAKPVNSATVRGSDRKDELWDRFWDMVDDPSLAAYYGVRVAQCEAPAVPVKLHQIWKIAVDAAGGINVKRVGTRTVAPDSAASAP